MEGSTPIMLAAEKGHKGIVLFLTQKEANLDLVNKVSVHVYMLYDKPCIVNVPYFILFATQLQNKDLTLLIVCQIK